MIHKKNKVNCSITIFCSIALLLIVSLLFSLTEMCRMRVCKLYMQVAANSATDSLFSLYHRELWNKYHIFGLESFDDNILKNEYESFLMPYIKDKNDKYINNHYIADIESEDISFTKEYILDNDYFEKEILSYMKYGMVNGILKFASKEFDIRKDSDKDEIYEEMSGAMKEHKDTTLYQKIYDKYFYFKNDIKILENHARDAMNYVSTYNNDIRNANFSTSASSNTASNNYGKLNNIESKLSNVKKTLNNFVSKMDDFRKVVRDSKSRYENDKKNIDGLDEEIDDFILSEYEYFEKYVDENSDMNQKIVEENDVVNNIYPDIYDYKNKCKNIMDEIDSLKAEKKDISRDKDMTASEKSEARKEINEALDNLYDEAKELGMALDEDKETFVIDELYLPVSMYGDLEKTSMYDKILEFMNNGFLSLCLEEEEINNLSKDVITYETFDIDGKNNFIDRVILSEYELNFFNFYNKDKYDMTTISDSKKYEVEQLISGKNVDKDNIVSVIEKILAIREGCNIVYLYGNPTKREEARAVANTLFAVFSPIVAEAMFIVILSSWALCQSFVDVYNIMHEKRVPFMHDDSTFTFNITSIVNMSLNTLKENIGSDNDKGLNYVDYLRVLLLFNDQKVLNSRMTSIIQYNMKNLQENFSMNNMIFNMDFKHVFHCKHFFTDMLFYRPDNVKLSDEYKMSINTYYDYIE